MRNAGLRIDHLLLSPSVAKRLTAAGVDRDVRGREKASDHAPAWIELSDRPQIRGARPRTSSLKGRERKSSARRLKADAYAPTVRSVPKKKPINIELVENAKAVSS